MHASQDFPHKKVDPYLLWAMLTGFRGLKLKTDSKGKRLLTLVKQTSQPAAPPRTAHGRAMADDAGMHDRQSPQPQHKFSWSSQFSIVTRTAHDIRPYIQNTQEAIELSVPRQVKPFDDVKFRGRPMGSMSRPILAVIDHGFAFAHQDFRRWDAAKQAWMSRIAWFWDQSFEQGLPRRVDPPYGRILEKSDIDALLQKHTHEGRVDEEALYRDASFPQADDVLTHGTHVLALAAGRSDETDCAATSDELILVQLPNATVLDTSGASMTAQVLLALDFVRSRVPATSPLVVNLSYAAASGPHTGCTFLERAMDEFTALRSQVAKTAIVLPAGNGYLADGHAQVKLSHRARRADIQWLVQTDDPTDSFVEIWYSCEKDGAGGLLISLQAPDGSVLGPVRADHTASDRSVAGIVHRAQSIFDPRKSVALVALAPTAHIATPRAAPGIWVIRLESTSLDTGYCLTVDAWVQRDDTTLNEPPRVRQSRFVSNRPLAERDEDVDSDPVHRAGTSNGFSHGKKTVVVGGSYGSGGLTRYTAAALPGVAATRDSGSWPDVISAAETSEALPGLPSAGTRGSARLRMNGTSVAAPQVARALMTAFKKPPGSQPGQGKPQSPDPLSSIIQPHPQQQQQQQPPAKPGLPNDALRCGKGSLIPTKKDC